LRRAAGLSDYLWSERTLTAGVTTIRAAHILDLRTALNEARSALDLPAANFPSGAIVVGATPIQAVHIQEVRDGAK